MSRIKDIAHQVGVSPSTVSYVFSGKRPISEDTRKQVEAAAKQLGYRPDVRGRSLRTKRTELVGVVAPFLNSFLSFLLQWVDQALQPDGNRILLAHPWADDDLLGLFKKGQVDGVIFLVPGLWGGIWSHQVRNFELPVVVVNQIFPGLPCVRTDYALGGAMAVEHLIAHGHRRIGFVGEDPNDLTQVAQLEGYCQALRQHGVEPDKALIVPDCEAALEQWGSLQDPPTSMFLTGEDFISSFYQLARKRRIRIPEDVAVVGCGDDRYDAALSPPLTTLAQPYRNLGKEAVRLLLERMRGEGEPGTEVHVPPSLVVRESCGTHGEV